MALDYSSGFKDYVYDTKIPYDSYGFAQQQNPTIHNRNLDLVTDVSRCNLEFYSPPSSVAHNVASSPEFLGDVLFFVGGGVAAERKKRRRAKNLKNEEKMENQRMTHIAVERNRRRQVNDYLAVLRSMMPPSYAQMGDQASIVGGAINFVKELEQLLQFFESSNPANQQHPNPFSDFFNFPQFTQSMEGAANSQSSMADIEVSMVESHANIKILTKRRPKQVVELVARFQSIGLTVLHLNITNTDQSRLYSMNLKVEDVCELRTANEIATAVHDIVGMVHQECGVAAPAPACNFYYV